MFHRALRLAALAALLAAPDGWAGERMNLISILTDDQGRWALGCYGNRECITPHMDRLAREGALFVNAFTATPVCSPSRAAFMTGKYGTQLGITDYINPAESDAGLGLPVGAVTWPQVLQRHGYRTALIGKWHLGTKHMFHPTCRGFDHFFGFLGGGNQPMNPTLERNGRDQKLQGPLPDLLVDEAIDFVDRSKSGPFALCLHFRAPHLPYGPVPEVDSALFRNLDPTTPQPPGGDLAQIKKWTRDYYASIHSVDRNLGRLFSRLEQLGIMDRTIILFTSDHGYMIGHHSLHTNGNGFWIAGGVAGPKRPNMFDDSIRVPLLVRWPGVVRPGTRIAEPVSNIDTFASVLGMLGVPPPMDWKHEGRDFSPLLRGESTPWRQAVFGQYDLHNGGLAYMRMIRTPEWKLVRHYHANGLDELYDLSKDPAETRNLYANPKHRSMREELQKQLTAWMQSVTDPILNDPRTLKE